MYVAQPIEWTERGVVMLDQRRLPAEEISYTYTSYQDVAKAIREMVIRGAPAIGVAAAMGVAIGVSRDRRHAGQDPAHRRRPFLGARPHGPPLP
jgi:methylthioribose-1-phosphate isomerase